MSVHACPTPHGLHSSTALPTTPLSHTRACPLALTCSHACPRPPQPSIVPSASNPTEAVNGKPATFAFSANPLTYSKLTLLDTCGGAAGAPVTDTDPDPGIIRFEYAFNASNTPAACTLKLTAEDSLSRVAKGDTKPVTVNPDLAKVSGGRGAEAGPGECTGMQARAGGMQGPSWRSGRRSDIAPAALHTGRIT
jgi:hypothetical protein